VLHETHSWLPPSGTGNNDRITQLRNNGNILYNSIGETVKNMLKAGALIGAHKTINISA
jgi:hypothetical protein